jgi:Flp pilus assembly protein TadD
MRMLASDIGVSGRARLLAWRITVEEMLPPRTLALGNGLSTFILDFIDARGRYFRRVQSPEHAQLVGALQYDRLHNDYLQVLVEGGLPALTLVCAALLGLGVAFWRRVATDDEPRRLERIAALCAFAGPAVHGFFSFPAHLAATSLGLIYAAGVVVAGAPGGPRRRNVPRMPAWAALAVLIALGALGVSVPMRAYVADVVRKTVESPETGQALQAAADALEAGLCLEPLNGPLHFARARTALAARDYAAARSAAREALRGINDVAIHAFLGLCTLQEGVSSRSPELRQARLAEARQHFADAAAMSVGDPTILYFHARAAALSGDPETAMHSLHQAIERDSARVDVWMLLGELHIRGGRLPEALRCFTEAAAAAPGNPKPWVALAAVHADLGQREQALNALQRSLELDPEDADARRLRQQLVGTGP